MDHIRVKNKYAVVVIIELLHILIEIATIWY